MCEIGELVVIARKGNVSVGTDGGETGGGTGGTVHSNIAGECAEDAGARINRRRRRSML